MGPSESQNGSVSEYNDYMKSVLNNVPRATKLLQGLAEEGTVVSDTEAHSVAEILAVAEYADRVVTPAIVCNKTQRHAIRNVADRIITQAAILLFTTQKNGLPVPAIVQEVNDIIDKFNVVLHKEQLPES